MNHRAKLDAASYPRRRNPKPYKQNYKQETIYRQVAYRHDSVDNNCTTLQSKTRRWVGLHLMPNHVRRSDLIAARIRVA